MITVGVIGTGYIGGVHLDALRRLGGVRVKSVCDVNIDYAKAAAGRFNVPEAKGDFKEIIDDPEIDVIHNCTPNKFHFHITKSALETGKQVMSEKPLAMTLDEAEQLVDLAERKQAVTGVHFCYRYYPVVQEMAARVRRGEAGKVFHVTGTWFQDWLSRDIDYSWRLDKSESGESNITADLGSHWFDLVQFVTGLPVTKVIGDIETIIPVRKKPKKQVVAFEHVGDVEYENVNVEVEEYSAVLFRLDGGVPGSFTASQAANGRKSDTEFQIYCSNYSLAWNHKWSDKLWIGHRDKPNETLTESPVLQDPSTARFASLPAGHPMGYNDAVLNLFKDYYHTLETGEELNEFGRPDFTTGYNEMVILDAVMKSVREKSWIHVGNLKE